MEPGSHETIPVYDHSEVLMMVVEMPLNPIPPPIVRQNAFNIKYDSSNMLIGG